MFQLPDWRDSKAYPSPDRASNSSLAWEFLRRNQGYQEAWRQYALRLREISRKDKEVSLFVDWMLGVDFPEIYSSSELNRLHSRFDDLPGVWVEDEVQKDGRILSMPFARHAALPWGLEGMVNPGRSYDFMSVRFLQSKSLTSPTSFGLKALEDEWERRSQNNYGASLRCSPWLVLQVNLEWPIEVIEEVVMRGITSQRRLRAKDGTINPISRRAVRPGLLVDYLRILDAYSGGDRPREIGAVLYPKASNSAPNYARNKRVEKQYDAACKMRDDGYRILPILSSKVKRLPRTEK